MFSQPVHCFHVSLLTEVFLGAGGPSLASTRRLFFVTAVHPQLWGFTLTLSRTVRFMGETDIGFFRIPFSGAVEPCARVSLGSQ